MNNINNNSNIEFSKSFGIVSNISLKDNILKFTTGIINCEKGLFIINNKIYNVTDCVVEKYNDNEIITLDISNYMNYAPLNYENFYNK